MPQPAPEILATIGPEQLPPALALPFDELEKVFLPEPAPARSGWCMLPDGTGFSSITTKMPLVTTEMEAWWGTWFARPDYNYLNYRIWLPGLHKSHAMPITENLGWGFVNINMVQPILPDMLKLSKKPEELDPAFLFLRGSSGLNRPEGEPDAEPYYTIILNVAKRFEGGIRVQTLAYSGMAWVDGGIRKMHDADPDKVRLFAMHNAYEFNREALLIPKLFARAKEIGER